MDNIEEITKKVESYTKKSVKKKRFEHSVRVAQMCSLLCDKFGIGREKGYLAGIGHDMCKECSDEELIKIASKDGKKIMPFEKNKPSLLHGRAAAVVMKEKFGIYDKDILEAVAYHTVGIVNMCDLTKCLFLADKIEPGRPQSTDEYRENLLNMPLEQMLLSVLIENYEYLVNKGIEIDSQTNDVVNYYKNVP